MDLSEETVQQVWDRARARPNRDPTTWRQDECGAWIKRSHYLNDRSDYGWHIENVTPGGPDAPENLRAYHLRNHFDQGVGRSYCAVVGEQQTLTNVPA